MFYRYEIKKDSTNEVLYLYFTMNYEFSNELSKIDNKNSNIKKQIKDYINEHHIKFNGKNICLITNGIIIKTIDINDLEDPKRINSNNKYSNDKYIINIHYIDSMTTINMRNYLLGTLATNCINNLELTSIKCMAILFRTYAFKMMEENDMVLATNDFVIYKPIEYYKFIWKDDYQYLYNKIDKAIKDTEGEFITYKDNYILPFYHICSNGHTSNNSKYPYLTRVDSIWDYTYHKYLSYKDFGIESLSELLRIKKEDLKKITILESSSNHIERIKIGNTIFSGNDFRKLLKLNSSDINIIIYPTHIRIITKGIGSNLGLSQFGANELAKASCSYLNILKYYFPSTEIKKYI